MICNIVGCESKEVKPTRFSEVEDTSRLHEMDICDFHLIIIQNIIKKVTA